MFHRKKKGDKRPSYDMAEVIAHSENQKQESRKELHEANEVASILRQIREDNHIVINLREVFGGR